MTQVFVNPDEIERFARDLQTFNNNLRDSTAHLKGQFARAADTWRDLEHTKFAKEFEQTMNALNRFVQASEKQIPLLHKKVAHLRAYQQTTQPHQQAVPSASGVFISALAPSLLVQKDLAPELPKLQGGIPGIKIQGRIGELSALRRTGGLDLNALRGNNFPTYDNYQDGVFVSVKVYGLKEFNKEIIQDYVRAFRRANLREGKESTIHRTAVALCKARNQGFVDLPVDLDESGILAYMHNHTERIRLQIPDDHVDAVRKAVMEYILKSLECIGKDELTEDAAWSIANNAIQPLGMISAAVRRIKDKHVELRRINHNKLE